MEGQLWDLKECQLLSVKAITGRSRGFGGALSPQTPGGGILHGLGASLQVARCVPGVFRCTIRVCVSLKWLLGSGSWSPMTTNTVRTLNKWHGISSSSFSSRAGVG